MDTTAQNHPASGTEARSLPQTATRRRFAELFEMPPQFITLIDRLFETNELERVLALGHGPFDAANCGSEWIEREFKRGLISKSMGNERNELIDTDGVTTTLHDVEPPAKIAEASSPEQTYELSNFYAFLDILVISRHEVYERLTPAEREAVDSWYFDTYYSRLSPDADGRPTDDRVLPLAEMLAAIDADERPFYLNTCDCRSLRGDCGMPTRTCLTHIDGLNSYVDRELLEPVTKEQAKDVVRMADKAGLMHTINNHGICNCCGDCCYLFRAQRRACSYGIWPASQWVISLDESRCVGCGRCVRRCHLDVFSIEARHLSVNTTRCAGCGLCATTCPRKALTLVPR